MITRLELKTRWQRLLNGSPETEEEESVSILFENDWVRILASRDMNALEQRRIEVEVSLPSQTDPESGKDVKNFLQSLIKHLEYLLRLDDEGLTLGLMTRDGLWTAHLKVESRPQDSLFNALIPPSV